MERFAIVDFGCKVNRYDGEVVRAELRRRGLEECDSDAAPDLLVVNTCAVTDRAVRRGRQALRHCRRSNPSARLLVTGCMTESDREGYAALATGGDALIVPAHDRDQLALRLDDFLGAPTQLAPVGSAAFPQLFEDRTRAYLKVEDGCDAHCSFCVIPQTRGGVRSKALDHVRREVHALLERGFGEIVVCGIHLGHYGRDLGIELRDLLDVLESIEGDFRVRLGSLEASEIDGELGARLTHSRRFAPHLHVPLQSGSDPILRAMRRPYTADSFRGRIASVRAAVPDLAITTDVIVGFPGETEDDFQSTLAFVEELACDRVHVFPFSPRRGTHAATLPQQVSPALQRTRVARLLRLERRLRAARDRAAIGDSADVLIHTHEGESGSAVSLGLCGRYRSVRLPGHFPRRSFVRARIVGVAGEHRIGEPLP